MKIFTRFRRTTISESFLEKSDVERLKNLNDRIDRESSQEVLDDLYNDLISVLQNRYIGKWPSVLYKLWKGGREA